MQEMMALHFSLNIATVREASSNESKNAKDATRRKPKSCDLKVLQERNTNAESKQE